MNNIFLRTKLSALTWLAIQQAGLHYVMFYNKNLNLPILLKECLIVFFHLLLSLRTKINFMWFLSEQMLKSDCTKM